MTRRLASIAALTDPAALEPALGPVVAVERDPMAAPGFSGSTLERITVRHRTSEPTRLVLKRVRPRAAWTAFRSEDRIGREAAILAEPMLAGIWNAFACPYVAYAIETGEIGLLMRDLSAHLFPDVRAPLAEDEEQALLESFASLHARFWESPALALPWLARPSRLLGMLGPRAVAETEADGIASPFLEKARAGWESAFRRLPGRVAARLADAVRRSVAWRRSTGA